MENFRGMADLEAEIKAWDVLSDEALEKMEAGHKDYAPSATTASSLTP